MSYMCHAMLQCCIWASQLFVDYHIIAQNFLREKNSQILRFWSHPRVLSMKCGCAHTNLGWVLAFCEMVTSYILICESFLPKVLLYGITFYILLLHYA